MPQEALESLAQRGHLHKASHSPDEIVGLIRRSQMVLADSRGTNLSIDSRFSLMYRAAHGFALAALWRHGYRSENRYMVFECLVHTSELSYPSRRVLANAHRMRNQMEYEAEDLADETLVRSLLGATEELARLMRV